jgi:hypothetical protein
VPHAVAVKGLDDRYAVGDALLIERFDPIDTGGGTSPRATRAHSEEVLDWFAVLISDADRVSDFLKVIDSLLIEFNGTHETSILRPVTAGSQSRL